MSIHCGIHYVTVAVLFLLLLVDKDLTCDVFPSDHPCKHVVDCDVKNETCEELEGTNIRSRILEHECDVDIGFVCNRSIRCENTDAYTENCFSCLDDSISIPINDVCNDVIDCPDLSDECLCLQNPPSICDDVIRNLASPSDGGKMNSGHCITRASICDETSDCPELKNKRHEFCQKKEPVDILTRCQSYCEVNYSTFLCNSKLFPTITKKIAITNLTLCDRVSDCSNDEDELSCEDGRFYCEGGEPLFVSSKKVGNDEQDCCDWSDECPSSPLPNSILDAIPSPKHIVGHVFLRVLVWIMGFTALAGNAVVIAKEVKPVYRIFSNDWNGALSANHLLIMNLAVADLLMGVYLVTLGLGELTVNGKFCQLKSSWCSSTLCSAMGTLVVLSSETSVLVMFLLTSLRLFSVFKPITHRHKPSKRIVLFLILCAWLTSFSLAVIPLLPALRNYFVKYAFVNGGPLFKSRSVMLQEVKDWAIKLPFFNLSLPSQSREEWLGRIENATTWENLIAAVGETSLTSYLKVDGYFGYYSANSVCIPRIFVKRNENAWQYSITLTIINFLLFLYVACAYCVIMIKANRSTAQVRMVSDKSRKGMQTRIFCLVATDFCCWAPITVMALLSFGGIPIPDTAYVISAIVLLPINSALNPIIYSGVAWVLFSKARTLRKSSFLPTMSTSSTKQKFNRNIFLPGEKYSS